MSAITRYSLQGGPLDGFVVELETCRLPVKLIMPSFGYDKDPVLLPSGQLSPFTGTSMVYEREIDLATGNYKFEFDGWRQCVESTIWV